MKVHSISMQHAAHSVEHHKYEFHCINNIWTSVQLHSQFKVHIIDSIVFVNMLDCVTAFRTFQIHQSIHFWKGSRMESAAFIIHCKCQSQRPKFIFLGNSWKVFGNFIFTAQGDWIFSNLKFVHWFWSKFFFAI